MVMNKNTYSEERLERIERFLRSQMSPEEDKAFINELQSDKSLRDDARLMAMLIKIMDSTREREDQHIVRMVRHYNKIDRKKAAQYNYDCCGRNDEAEHGDDSLLFEMNLSTVKESSVDADARKQTERKHIISRKHKAIQSEKSNDSGVPLEMSADKKPEQDIPTAMPQRRTVSIKRFMKWALPIAAMVIMVFGSVILFKKKSSQMEMTQKNVVVQNKQQEKGNEKPEEAVADGREGCVPAESPAEKDITMYGDTLPDIEPETDAKAETLLATIDKAIEDKEDLTPFINEMQDILDGIKNDKEEYARFKPFKVKFDWRLAAALAIDGEGCLAKDVLDDMAGEENILAEMLRNQYQCDE